MISLLDLLGQIIRKPGSSPRPQCASMPGLVVFINTKSITSLVFVFFQVYDIQTCKESSGFWIPYFLFFPSRFAYLPYMLLAVDVL